MNLSLIPLLNAESADFEKQNGLLPAIIQDVETRQVLMLGYMNSDALLETRTSGKVTFYSRSKGRLWQKGESSGHVLDVVSMSLDCDNDTLLVLVRPFGPTCHRGLASCFSKSTAEKSIETKDNQDGEVSSVGSVDLKDSPDVLGIGFLAKLFETVEQRKTSPKEKSYTADLFAAGLDRIVQKVGEEAVEIVIAAKNSDASAFLGEVADLMYHLCVLLAFKNLSLNSVVNVLRTRHRE